MRCSRSFDHLPICRLQTVPGTHLFKYSLKITWIFAAYFVVQENQILHWQVRGKQGRSAWPEEWYSMQQVTFEAKHRTMGEHKDKGKFNTGRKGKSFSIWRCGPSLPCRPTPLSRQVGMQNWIVKITPRRHLLHNYQHTNRTYGEGWKEIDRPKARKWVD